MAKRPDLKNFWRSRIDNHVNGMLAGPLLPAPRDVVSIDGRITDPVITVTMRDGTVWLYSGGRYAAKKRNGCYAPLIPQPMAPPVDNRDYMAEAGLNADDDPSLL